MKEFPSFHCSDWQIFYIRLFREIKTYYDISLWGFSPFESSFSAKMAKATPTQVFVNKNVLTERERERENCRVATEYKVIFNKFDCEEKTLYYAVFSEELF